MTERKGPGWERLKEFSAINYSIFLATEVRELLNLQDAYWQELLDASERLRAEDAISALKDAIPALNEANRLRERITELEIELQEIAIELSKTE